MAKPLNVLFLSSEVEPFAKTGGLADVAGALPQYLKHLDVEVRITMPRYGSIDGRRFKLHDMARLREISVPVGGETHSVSLKSSFIGSKNDKVQVYFIDIPNFFGRNGLYVDAESKKDFPDNDERFILFSRATLEVLKRLGWQPDILHCNDWQTGLIPAYLKTVYGDDPFYRETKVVFTIHNMAYQGIFPKSSFAKTGLPAHLFSPHGVEAYGSVNMLKSGLVFSDAITTVSRKYAEEIRSNQEFGCGLQGVVAARQQDVSGILNGIDYEVWNPAIDELIPQKYDSSSLDLKQENKKELLNRFNLPYDEHMPVIGMISRLADQKGFDLIGQIMDQLMALDLQLVILGTGEKKYHDMLERAHQRYPARMGIDLSFNNELAHLIEAGSDMFLMPSRYEPCGLNQMYSLKYGTIPIVRATGGLDDTIDDLDEKTGKGTGFKFQRYDSGELLHAIRRALEAFRNTTAWRKIMKNAMAKDYSWESSAKKYVQLYRSLAKK
jgi:starch synthase